MANVINATSTGNGGLVSTGDDSGILNIQTNETTAITVDTSQNVGIGATPNSKLYIRAATNANLRVTDSSGTLNLSAENDAGSAQVAMKFNGSQMMLDASGRLMIGTTTTSISSSDAKYFDAADGQRLFSARGSTAAREHMLFQNPNGTVGSISTTGSATAYNTSSDYRLKENITPMTGALEKVAQLKPVTYKWKVDGSDGEGFIAHELAEVCPDAVVGTKDAVDADGNPKYQGIDVSFLVATLTAALQETKAINDTQAETINALTARIVALEQA